MKTRRYIEIKSIRIVRNERYETEDVDMIKEKFGNKEINKKEM